MNIRATPFSMASSASSQQMANLQIPVGGKRTMREASCLIPPKRLKQDRCVSPSPTTSTDSSTSTASEMSTASADRSQTASESSMATTTRSPSVQEKPCIASAAVPGLPDEVLVRVLGFIGCAPTLARLRLVSRSWCSVIDGSPSLWANASFKRTDFSRRVVETSWRGQTRTEKLPNSSSCPTMYALSSTDRERSHAPARKRRRSRLALGGRPGYAPLCIAASAGNEWAAFLRDTFFLNRRLRAVTLSSPVATALVEGRVNAIRPPACLSSTDPYAVRTPPWAVYVHPLAGNLFLLNYENVLVPSAHVPLLVQDDETCARGTLRPQPAPPAPGWIAVHAARSRDTGGRLVGVVHVSRLRETDDKWSVMRAVALAKPIYCAGYVGLWEMTNSLAETLVRGLHGQ